MHQNQKRILLTYLLFLIITHGSNASFLNSIRKLGAKNQKPLSLVSRLTNEKPVNQKDDQTAETSPAPEPTGGDGFTSQDCLNPCHDLGNITACLGSSPGASGDLFLIVKNGGGSTLKVNVTLSTLENTYDEIEISGYQTKKVNISANNGGGYSIVLNAGNGECTISMQSPTRNGNIFQHFPSFATPVNGVYLLLTAPLIIGLTWACCKTMKMGKQVDGIPYKELEMAQPDSVTADNVETAEGWEQDWDGDWDET